MHLRHRFVWMISFFIGMHMYATEVAVRATSTAQIGIVVASIGSVSLLLQQLIDTIKRDLAASGQLRVLSSHFTTVPTQRSEITQHMSQGALFCLMINKKGHVIEYRLFDTTTGDMIAKASGSYRTKSKNPEQWAHHITEKLWPVFTGHRGIFSSKLAYCKEVQHASGKLTKQVCVADYDGKNERTLVHVPTITVAPRWSSDAKQPLLFYSEYTPTNVRLMSVDMNKKRRVVSNFEGINMQLSFSQDGKAAVYCASHGDGRCQLYQFKDNALEIVASNSGNNASPTFADDGNVIYYCSDFQTGSPQIYAYHFDTGKTRRITSGGYCASPSYCSERKQLVYGKSVNGVMQLFLYDEATKQHTQLTTGSGNKEECCWSPCGNYIAYAQGKGLESRIAVYNLITKQEQLVTAADVRCSYPAWSPCFKEGAFLV